MKRKYAAALSVAALPFIASNAQAIDYIAAASISYTPPRPTTPEPEAKPTPESAAPVDSDSNLTPVPPDNLRVGLYGGTTNQVFNQRLQLDMLEGKTLPVEHMTAPHQVGTSQPALTEKPAEEPTQTPTENVQLVAARESNLSLISNSAVTAEPVEVITTDYVTNTSVSYSMPKFLEPQLYEPDYSAGSISNAEVSGILQAHTVSIEDYRSNLVTEENINVWAKRKLEAQGYLPIQTADLSGLTERGKTLLRYYNKSEVRSLLATIRYAEGTLNHDYKVAFGFRRFNSFEKHPNVVWPGGSSAAGPYQFMDYTWPNVRDAVGLKDFTPLSQDLAALHQLVYKHGIDLESYDDSKFEPTIRRLSKEWASLPYETGYSYYNRRGGIYHKVGGTPQPSKSINELWQVYSNARSGNIPRMGIEYSAWTDQDSEALKKFQQDNGLPATGTFDAEGKTQRVLFNGESANAIAKLFSLNL